MWTVESRFIELVGFPVAIVKCWCANTLQGTLCSKQCILQGVVGGRCVDDGDGSCVRAGGVKTACLGRESYFFLIVSLRRVVVLCCGVRAAIGGSRFYVVSGVDDAVTG